MTPLNHPASVRARLTLASALVVGLSAAMLGGCLDTDSATDLNPDGPPMIEQVRLKQSLTDANGIIHTPRVFGFGTFAAAKPEEQPGVDNIKVAATTNAFRVIMDELLVGNNLEEIACSTDVDDDQFDFVPLGTTPDDIARCSTAPDELPLTCVGDHTVCICHRDAGCKLPDGSTVSSGAPVGILDMNQDGASDLHRFRKGSVTINCAGNIDVPVNLDASYWNPSGNQQEPAMGGFDALGPAVVLQPLNAFPANIDCKLVFADDVVDKQGINVCAPPGGDVAQTCDPGNTDAFTFHMEPLIITLSSPSDGGTLNRTDDIILSASDGIPLSMASLGGIQLKEGNTPYTTVTITLDTSGANITIHSTAPGGFDPNATYTLTVPTTVTDTYGQAVVQPLTATFMTTGT